METVSVVTDSQSQVSSQRSDSGGEALSADTPRDSRNVG